MKKNLSKSVSLLMATAMIIGSGTLMVPMPGVQAENLDTLGNIQAEFFVSPDGDDSNEGTYEKPFATIEAARDAVRKINDDMEGDIYVYLAEGQYYLDKTIVFTEEDSGTNGHKVVYRNLDELGSAELIGGKTVDSKWELVDASGYPATDPDADLPDSAEGKVYKTNLGKDVDFETLYVNDKRATLARTQNRSNENGFDSALTPYMRSASGGVGDLVYKSGDLDEDSINGLVNAKKRGDLNASVYMWDGGYWDWMTDTIPISDIDTGARRLTYKTVDGHPEMYRPKYATRNNARYFVQGNLGFLDAAGEYYFNDKTGDLYYYPEGNIEDLEFVVPYVKEIVRVEGASMDTMVENIEFSGLQFKDADTTEWYTYGWNWGDAGDGLGFYPEEATGSTQPSYCEQTERVEFQYGNITLKNTRNIAIKNSHIKNSGMFGINLYLANQGAVIQNNLIEYTAHGGISIDGGYPGVAGDENGDGYSRDHLIENIIVHDIGELVGQASGITIQQSGYNKVSHVEVYNSPRRGIFLTAGNSRNKAGADAGYSQMRDLYTHHNTIEYAYLHDCQQDGGDDGAFFACYLYNKNWYGNAEYKPNYVNQMVIDNVAANPSMQDIAPNGINLDMGCSGMELSNVKVVNPQHFNMEVESITNNGDVIKFDNVNVDFGTHTNLVDSFDDSKMEYDQIGVTMDYPEEYRQKEEIQEVPEDIYFSDDFENGLDYSKWSSKGGTPEITTEWMSEGVLGGRQALKINSDKGKPVLYREFSEGLNKVVTMKLFDRAGFNLCSYTSGVNINANITTYGRVDDGKTAVGMGIDNAVGGGSNGVYVIQVGDEKIKTEIGRFYGWHELKWDYTSGKDVKLYFDGQLVKTLTKKDGVSTDFDYVAMGSENGSGITFFDELYIYGGKEAEAPGNVPLPEVPGSEGGANEKQLTLDFEDGKLPEFEFTVKDNEDRLYQKVVEENGNQILEHYSGDGHAFYQTDAKWDNYLVNFKWKFGGWSETDPSNLNHAYDNFTIYVMTNLAGDERPTNPGSYQVIYRRNKNGIEGFEAGTPYFEVSKHRRDGETLLARVAVPEGFNDQEWHNFQIQAFDGKVALLVDGKQLMTANDSEYTHGGIGFGGISAKAYLDDIEIITNPTILADNQEQLKLDFEDGNLPEFYFSTTDPDRLGQEIVEENGNKILKQYSGDGNAFYETNAPWQNYLVNFKWKLEGWGDKDILSGAYDNFTVYLMTTSDGSDKQNNNPLAYQVVYRRNKNGTEKFEAGVPYFEVMKHSAGGDTSLGKAAVPEGFDHTQWHDFQIQTFDGKVGFVLDGEPLLSIDDGQYTNGGIGFGGINQTAYMDDIQIITNPTYVKYDDELGLTNIEINGVFNPNCYEYFVAVKDKKQDVVFSMPEIITAGVNVTASLNGTEIGDQEVLNLKTGSNELVITESTYAGDKNYVITIYNTKAVTEVGEIAPVTTEQGKAPVLPEKVMVTFEDGSQQETEINWRQIVPANYKKNGTFTVTGSLKDLPVDVRTTVTVTGFEAIGQLEKVTTTIGNAPTFPETITATYTDGERQLPLAFAGVLPQLYEKEGIFVVPARAEGYRGDLLQFVKVTKEEPGKPEKADKDKLKELIDEANKIEFDKYTKESVDDLKEALKKAEEVMNDETLTSKEQSVVDEAAKLLSDAIKGLKPISADGEKPGAGDKNDGNADDGNKGEDHKNEGNDAPKTGDNAPIVFWTVCVMCAGAVLILKIRKKQQA